MEEGEGGVAACALPSAASSPSPKPGHMSQQLGIGSRKPSYSPI